MIAYVRYSVAGRSRGRGGTMCGLHHARRDREHVFLG
jgi:hypothetical protein